MGRILNVKLINTPSPFLINDRAFVPLGLLYVAGMVRHLGHNIEILDLLGNSEYMKSLEGVHGDVFGMAATTPQYPVAVAIMQQLKDKNPHAKFIIGGSHVTLKPQAALQDGFDIVMLGEGENAIKMILNQLSESGKCDPIVQAPYIENLDEIPYPARDLIDIKSYGYEFEPGHRATTIMTSRGCPWQCSFCAKDVFGKTLRFRSPENVVGELKEVISQFGIRDFLFLDDVMTLNRKRIEKMLELMEPLNINWRCYSRVDTLDRELLIKMKRAGCKEIGSGVESGSQKILDSVRKGSTVLQNTKVARLCKEVGIVFNAFIMIGLPGESYETVMETKRWFEEVLPEKFGYNIFSPYQGTDIFQNPQNYDILLNNMPDDKSWVKGRKGEYNCFVETKDLNSEEILRLHKSLFEYFVQLTGWHKNWVDHSTKRIEIALKEVTAETATV